eukprot:TRINITY_DN54160_c0_g1_i1.p1 TRINITY_DN54160_c0_g1~~TRINITY_DN54160_c0_g1_i1.p1  ORF type:complete len:113 (-),score=14.92 TRINITY_DN54160_c0_g1_i1:298-636(-)
MQVWVRVPTLTFQNCYRECSAEGAYTVVHAIADDYDDGHALGHDCRVGSSLCGAEARHAWGLCVPIQCTIVRPSDFEDLVNHFLISLKGLTRMGASTARVERGDINLLEEQT